MPNKQIELYAKITYPWKSQDTPPSNFIKISLT